MSWIMTTGGVVPSEENLKAWFDAWVSCAVMGAKLISKLILQEKNTILVQSMPSSIKIIGTISGMAGISYCFGSNYSP